MKNLRRFLLLCLTAVLVFAFGFTIVSCNNKPDNNSQSSDTGVPDTDAYVYRVSVINETGFGFGGVTVSLYDGETKIASKNTNINGNANFFEDDLTIGNYTVGLENIPEGYELIDSTDGYQTVAQSGTKVEVMIRPTGLLDGPMPENTRYQLGEVMYDFSITTSDGSRYTLSEVLKEKKLVLINLWATWCGPCKQEFPAMHNAATLSPYDEEVSILAISVDDSTSAVAAFKESNQYTAFDMAGHESTEALKETFYTDSVPHTLMVDRYGVIVYNHVGSMTSYKDFTTQFDKFIGDDYVPTVVGSIGGGDGGEEIVPETYVEAPKEIVNAKPSNSSIQEAVNPDGDLTFRFQDEGVVEGDESYDVYSWPWLLSADKSYLYASNANIHYSYATIYADFNAGVGDVLCFDYKIGSEDESDILYVLIDEVPVYQLSGNHAKDWQTCYAYVVAEGSGGDHELSLLFLKDSATTAYEDVVQVKNFRFTTVDAIQNDPNVNANIFTHAATVLNTDENATTQFKYYIDPVYNEEDLYYHVGSKNGPILFANMMLTSPWSQTSLWLLAYNGYIVDEYGISYQEAIEDFAWEASNNILVSGMYGYTPVTKELRALLEITVSCVDQYKNWDGEWHANEWLELCIYYDHYGATPQMADPMKGISFTAAIPMQEGDNAISVPFAMNPRGFKYKFTPTRSGAYRVYSTGDSDPFVFLASEEQVKEYQTTHNDLQFLGTWDNKLFLEDASDEYDGNFEFKWFFEAGKTYYMLFTTVMDQVANYNVTIEYIGTTYLQLTPGATMYSQREGGDRFILDPIRYTYNEDDGLYHAVNNDGSLGGVIYLSVKHTTYFTPLLNSIYHTIESMKDEEGNFTGEFVHPEKRPFYINGVDYTDILEDYAFRGMQNDGLLNGFVAVDQELFDVLNVLVSLDDDGTLENEWLLLCYHLQELSSVVNS